MRYFYFVYDFPGGTGSMGRIQKNGHPSRSDLQQAAKESCGLDTVITNIIEMTEDDFLDFFPEEIDKICSQDINH